jgi:hypothetical protein
MGSLHNSSTAEAPNYGNLCAVMTDRWRLVNNKELYDRAADPGQTPSTV